MSKIGLIAALFALGGLISGLFGWSLFRDSQPYVRLAGLVVLSVSLTLFFVSIVTLTRSKNRIVAVLATLVIAGVIAAQALPRFLK